MPVGEYRCGQHDWKMLAKHTYRDPSGAAVYHKAYGLDSCRDLGGLGRGNMAAFINAASYEYLAGYQSEFLVSD
jgi:hypothetical protein